MMTGNGKRVGILKNQLSSSWLSATLVQEEAPIPKQPFMSTFAKLDQELALKRMMPVQHAFLTEVQKNVIEVDPKDDKKTRLKKFTLYATLSTAQVSGYNGDASKSFWLQLDPEDVETWQAWTESLSPSFTMANLTSMQLKGPFKETSNKQVVIEVKHPVKSHTITEPDGTETKEKEILAPPEDWEGEGVKVEFQVLVWVMDRLDAKCRFGVSLKGVSVKLAAAHAQQPTKRRRTEEEVTEEEEED